MSDVSRQTNHAQHFQNQKSDSLILAKVNNAPIEKKKSLSCELRLLSSVSSKNSKSISGTVRAYFAKDSLSDKLSYGDILLLENTINSIDKPRNPYQFDFKSYYAHKNIYHQAYFKSGSWTYTGNSVSSRFWEITYSIRRLLQKRFETHFENKAIRGVASAIIIGYKEDLDDNWLDAFSKTGTIHVLAVSGLHVGIIYILLSIILGLNRATGSALKIKSFIILLALFGYCLLTGFSPSVCRASIMFGTVLIAKAINRQSNIYNTLALSAFILLVFDPFTLFHVGFQFSYLAVLGIVYYKDIFRSWVPVKTWLGDKIATLLSVSVAAQITTFPLGLYYFHQYPNFFMFSNLIVIPCITIILYAGIFFLMSSLVSSFFASFFAKIMTAYIGFIATVVNLIKDVPFAFLEGIHITFFQMILCYAFIVMLTATLRNRWSAGLFIAPIIVIAFLWEDHRYEQSLNREEVVLFDVRNETLVGFRTDNSFTLVASDGVFLDESVMDFIIEPYMTNTRVNRISNVIPMSSISGQVTFGSVQILGNGLLTFGGESYLFLDGIRGYVSDTLQVDHLIVGSAKSDGFVKKVTQLITHENSVLLNSWRSKRLVDCIKTDTLHLQTRGHVIIK